MQIKKIIKNNLALKSRLESDTEWYFKIPEVIIPCKIYYTISNIEELKKSDNKITKIIVDTGCETFVESSYKRYVLNDQAICCTYKSKQFRGGNTTVVAQASVFVDKTTCYITPTFIINNIKITDNQYVNAEVFTKQIMKYYKDNKFTQELADSIQKIATRLAYRPNFINYSYREDMIGDAIIKMVEALTKHKFDPLRGKSFSYFTKIALHAFFNRIKNEKKAHTTITNYKEETYLQLAESGVLARPKRIEASSSDDGQDILTQIHKTNEGFDEDYDKQFKINHEMSDVTVEYDVEDL